MVPLRLRYFALLAVAGLAVWIALYPADWRQWLGFSQYDYFKAGVVYAFFSGPAGPILTALGMSSILITLLRHLNCHTAGCPRIVRHKIADGEYGVCGRHWREINGQSADHKFTIEHLRDRHRAHLSGRDS